MPDWSYAPLIRPFLTAFGSRAARTGALRATAALAALPFGARFIEAFGDMTAPASLRRAYGPVELVSPIGLGAGLDPTAVATTAFSGFGFGYIEIGPVTRAPIDPGPIARDDARGEIRYDEPLENPGLEAIATRCSDILPRSARLAFRIAHARGATPDEATAEARESLVRLAGYAAFFTLDMRPALDDGWPPEALDRHVEEICRSARGLPMPVPLVIAVPPDGNTGMMLRIAAHAVTCGAVGMSVSGGAACAGSRVAMCTGTSTRAASIERVRALRSALGDDVAIVGSGGVESPVDALALFDAGANLVQLHSGLVFSGPALAKRINEALVSREADAASRLPTPVSLRNRWTWGVIYALALAIAAAAIAFVGLGRVVLPYDEVFLGMTRAQIDALDPRLIPFMIHDRVTLAGTLFSIAILYFGLSAYGIRYGERWAWRAMLVSSVVAFASYWLWLRLGYFEPLHALATMLVLPLFVAFALTKMPSAPRRVVDDNDVAWRRSLVAQLLFATCGFGFVVGGLTVAVVGITSIFVHSDLVFLGTTAAALDASNVHLLPLIAHDRAGFGGALASDGLALALASLWGFRRGAAWLWWTLLAGGIPGFAATLLVHGAVGYVDFWHLAPVWFAATLYVAGLWLAYPYLCVHSRFGREE